MEWLVEKINRKLEMFLKTKDAGYLLKAQECLKDLMNESDLEKTWEAYYQEWKKHWIDIAENQKDMPPEFQKTVDDNFWDLI